MFDNLLIHDKTLKQLEVYAIMPSHGLVLVGPDGSGKLTLAKHLAASILGLKDLNSLKNYPYFYLVNPDSPTITIDEIRQTQKLLTLKTPETSQNIRRVIILPDAGRMRTEAQNAFLKTLEEPPADTCIILTSEGANDLLPTIYSRVQRIDVQPISETTAQQFYKAKGLGSSLISSAHALSKGQPGLLNSLLQKEDHPLKNWVESAKELLKKPAGERLLEVDLIAKEKTDAKQLIGALKRIAHAALNAASKAQNTKSAAKWQAGLKLAQEAEEALAKNANTKLVLDQLLINI